MPQMCPACSHDNPDKARICEVCQAPLRHLLSKGTVLESRYRLLQILGCGGMGAVYLADDSRITGRQVAVKENLDTSVQAQHQFQIEVELMIDLKHPALPNVSDQFLGPQGRQYLVMDYIEGETLEENIKRCGPLVEKDVVAVTKQLLNVLDHLHRRSIIHRDVKPANIKLKPSGQLILVDFGLAKRYLPGQQTQTAARGSGSPGFAAPEQYGSGTDARSDLYSVGAVMYYMLTGKMPPQAPLLAAGVRLEPPRHQRPDLSTHIQSVTFKAMNLNPAYRYQSVAEMRRALMSPVSSRISSQSLPPVKAEQTLHSQPARLLQSNLIKGKLILLTIVGVTLVILLLVGIVILGVSGSF